MLNKTKRLFLFFAPVAMLAIAYAGCAKKIEKDNKILAKVSDRFITLKDFKNRFSKLPAHYQTIIDKNKKRFLDEMVVEMIFYEEAIKKGLDKDKEVRDVINEARKKILIAKLIKDEVEDNVKVEDKEVRQIYDERKEDFKTPELWRASHILVNTEPEARDILSELAKGADFEELAKAHSVDATASRGGDIGFFKTGQLVPDFEKAALKLNMGETSGIVHTQFGFHVIKLTDKKESEVEPYDKVKELIEDELKRKKRSGLFDKLVLNLKKKYKVKIEEDVFESLESIAKEDKEEEKSK